MKFKYLFLFLFLIIFAGCRKIDTVKPGEKLKTTETDEPVITPTILEFSVASILQSNMVVQRDKPFKIWGTAPIATTVTVAVSWSSNSIISTASGTGKWEAVFPAAAANANAQTITITTIGKDVVKLDNILIGDVWLCAGQSNMVMPMGNIAPFQGVENFATEIAAANYPQIRYFTANGSSKATPQTDYEKAAEWKVCSPTTAANFSGAAYYFARRLHADLNVPIGVVVAAVNGSWCESWMNSAAFETDQVLSVYTSSNKSILYNGMVSPLTNLGIKGFLWCQGENDQKMSPPSLYTRLNMALIRGWRKAFAQGDLPFYYVQLTPFDETKSGDMSYNWLAYFREAQANLRELHGTGMAVTLDAGEVDNHHPKYKKPVGERLALLALKNTYGLNVQSLGPQYQSFTQTGNKIIVSFRPGTATGLTTTNNLPINQYFFVAGADRIFRKGQAEINGEGIMITIPADSPMPVVTVRYAFSNFPITNLQNSAGLPMEPFRSDDWEN